MKKRKFEDKLEFRAWAKKRLLQGLHGNALYFDKKVLDELLKIIKKEKPKRVLLYVPMDIEVDISPLITHLRKRCEVFVPFMEGVSFKMVKFRLPLIRKRFSIKEPKNSFLKVSRLDLAIVPVLGVDGTCKRIGFGKGMYDRFFCSLRKAPKIIFTQRVPCVVKQNLCEKHDVQADMYITPFKTFVKRGHYDNRIQYRRRHGSIRRHSRVPCCQKIKCGQL